MMDFGFVSLLALDFFTFRRCTRCISTSAVVSVQLVFALSRYLFLVVVYYGLWIVTLLVPCRCILWSLDCHAACFVY